MAPKPVRTAPGSAPRTVFVLDDEEGILYFLGKMLSHSGLTPSLFSDVASFKKAFAEQRPDFAIIDLALQADDGIGVLRALSAVEYKGRVVLMSGVDERVLEAAARYGAECGLDVVGRLQKPFDMPRLRSFLLAHELVPLAVGDEDVLKALADNQLYHVFQPKLDLRSGRITGGETLLRWKHPIAGDLVPSRFLPQLSPTAMQHVTLAMFAQLFEQVRGWEQQGLACDLAINVPAELVAKPDFYEWIKTLRISTGVRAPFTLEVTEEDASLNDLDACVNIARFRLAGLSIALDDFGKGYSSLARLRSLPISELKIDQVFVDKLAVDEINQVIVKSVMTLAQGLRLKVTAEGVEDAGALDHLRLAGCDFAQGYYIGRPMAAGPFERLMRAQSTATGASAAAATVSGQPDIAPQL